MKMIKTTIMFLEVDTSEHMYMTYYTCGCGCNSNSSIVTFEGEVFEEDFSIEMEDTEYKPIILALQIAEEYGLKITVADVYTEIAERI